MKAFYNYKSPVAEFFSMHSKANLPSIVFAKDLLCDFIDIIGGRESIVICDSNTVLLLAYDILTSSNANIKFHILPSDVMPSEMVIEEIINNATGKTLIVALGSGTISDIVKRVAFLLKVDCCLFPTAASVNAFTSSNTSIILKNGNKVSLNGILPKEIYIDVTVISNAPKILTYSGFADLVCRASVELDCLLSHVLFDTYYDSRSFQIIKDYESLLMGNYDKFDSDSSLVVMLMKGLIDSGLCMYYANGSMIASQGEHQISHAIEIKTGKKYIHGSLIALNTVFMLKIQKEILKLENIIPKYKELNRDYLCHFYGDELGNVFYNVYSNKIKKINNVNFDWKKIKLIIKDKLENHNEFSNVFSKLQLPLSNIDINLEWNVYNEIVNTAFCTRDRFTFLDLMNFVT